MKTGIKTAARLATVFGLSSIAAFSLGSITGCSSGTHRSTGQTVDDASITARVKSEIAQEQGIGDALRINVDTYRGVVSLTGFVENQDQIQKAVTCANRVPGVKEVKNNLSVKPKA